MAEKYSIMLAGDGHDLVFYNLQPPFLPRADMIISSLPTTWATLRDSLEQTRPDVLVVHSRIAPGPDDLLKLLADMKTWNGAAIVLLSEVDARLQGAFAAMTGVVAGVYVEPINFATLPDEAFRAGQTVRSRTQQITAQPQVAAAVSSAGMSGLGASAFAGAGLVTGTKRIAFLSHCGGAGTSTLAEALGYELAVRLSVRTLLLSLGLPPAAVPHFSSLRYNPSLTEFFERPGKPAIQSAIQRVEGLDVLLAPENSLEYLKGAANSADLQAPNSIASMLLAADDGQYAALLMDLPTTETEWDLHALSFANTGIIVARPTMADLFATHHTLNWLSNLGGILPRESTYLVLNQAGAGNAFTPRQFLSELSEAAGWTPPILAVIDSDPAVQAAQDQRAPAVSRSESLAKGVRQIIGGLFPRLGNNEAAAQVRPEPRSRLFPKFRLG
ncbi:MAG: hypothetical protein CO094_08920 [Anaerolineae bacterium CG_4_9_14_3_um_filter_57_17]|nr:hypothetical protein [bacterium]NCT21678.1 hypothetical protein [bacterium]OIO86730.1 MAG: hypothetical protein AUK01_02210 [Anaerolineae bacterium CG2_30_57_67]PJB65826.1 MAG: hypothetical protein CO094_08920 [Anaerolineae bacterium CG_4_9_14_3_um_filter_57_17]